MRTKRQPARQSIWENRFGYLPAALSVGIGLLLAGLAALSGLLLLSDLSEWIPVTAWDDLRDFTAAARAG